MPAGSATTQVNEVPVRLDQEKRAAAEGLSPGTTLKKKGPALPSGSQVMRRGWHETALAGVLTMMALTVDAAAATRVATESNFITALCDEGGR